MAEAYVWPELKGRNTAPEVAPDDVRRLAREEGHAEGLAQGLQEGRQKAEAEVAAVRTQLAAAVERVDAYLEELRRRDLGTLAAVSLALCRNVLGWELRTTPEAFELMLRDGLAKLEVSAEDVDVYLHPDDHAWLQTLYHGSVAVHADPGVARGGLSVRCREQAADFDPHHLLDHVFADAHRDLVG